MDRFNNSVTHSKYIVKNNMPLPNRPNSGYLYIEVSSDNFLKFIRDFWNVKVNAPVRCVIHDEGTNIHSSDLTSLRLRMLEMLNRLNIRSIDFKLSDAALKEYNALMHIVRWNHISETTLDMTINRHPFNNSCLNLDTAKGRLLLPEEDLIWLPDITIRNLSDKIKPEEISEVLRLKRVVEKYCADIDRIYESDKLTDLDKLYLAYNYMKAVRGLNIEFASSQTYLDEHGVQRLRRSETGWESKAIGTYEHRQGVCEGQARLLKALITNPYMRVNSEVISGRIPTGESHAWLGVVSRNKLYQVCLTMRGMYANLDRAGYVPNEKDVYSKAYPHAYLETEDARRFSTHVRSLRRY